MARFRKIYVNSSHRKSGTPTRFRYELPMDQECTEKTHVAITAVSLPNVFYGVQTSVNDGLYIYEKHSTTESLSQNRILLIPTGNYSATTLNAQIQTLLNAGGLGTYSCNYNSVTQKITISQTSSGGFLIYDDHTLKTLGRKNPASSGFYGTLPTFSNPQSINQILNTPTPGDPNVVFHTGIITLARVTEAYLRSPNLTNMSTLDCNGRMDVLRRILIDKDFGNVVTSGSNVETSDLMDCSGKTLRSIDFLLTDAHGNQLDLGNIDWSFSLNFVYGQLE